MFTRRLKLPERTFFLLGPRGTGKDHVAAQRAALGRVVRPAADWDVPGVEPAARSIPPASRGTAARKLGGRRVGIEVKAATQWRREFGGPLKWLIEDGVVQRGFGVYTGTAELKDGPLRVLPLVKFLTELAAGNVSS